MNFCTHLDHVVKPCQGRKYCKLLLFSFVRPTSIKFYFACVGSNVTLRSTWKVLLLYETTVLQAIAYLMGFSY